MVDPISINGVESIFLVRILAVGKLVQTQYDAGGAAWALAAAKRSRQGGSLLLASLPIQF